MKTRLEYAYYDPISRISFAGVRRGDKIYKGMVELDPEDADIISAHAGCRFAEHKARIKMYKDILRERKRELKVLEDLYTKIEDLNVYQSQYRSPICRFIRKQIYIKQSEVHLYEDLVAIMQEGYVAMIEERADVCRVQIPKILGNQEFRKHMLTLGLEDDEASCIE